MFLLIKTLERHSLNVKSVSPMFWLQENLILIKEMLNCSFLKKFLLKKILTLMQNLKLQPIKVCEMCSIETQRWFVSTNRSKINTNDFFVSRPPLRMHFCLLLHTKLIFELILSFFLSKRSIELVFIWGVVQFYGLATQKRDFAIRFSIEISIMPSKYNVCFCESIVEILDSAQWYIGVSKAQIYI